MALTDKLKAVADAIRGKTGGTEELTLDQMATEIAGIETGGGESPLDYAVSLHRMFYMTSYSKGTDIVISFGSKVPTIKMYGDGLSHVMYRSSNIRSIKISWGGAASSVSMNCFAEINWDDTTLEKVDLSGALGVLYPTNMSRAFYRRSALREILGEFDLTNCTSLANTFTNCYALETIRFKAGTIKIGIEFVASPNLTDESIQSIIDGLADLTGGTAQTLTLNATVGAKLTDEQKAAASAKNWTIAY